MTVHRGPRHAPDPLCFGGGAGTLADLRGFLAFEAADLPTGKPAVRGHALAQPLAPGVETTVPLYLRCPRGPGDRVVAVAVGCRGPLKWCLLCTWLSIGWGLGRQVRYQLQAAAEQAADESTVTVEERVHVAKPFVLASTLTPQTVWPARAHRVTESERRGCTPCIRREACTACMGWCALTRWWLGLGFGAGGGLALGGATGALAAVGRRGSARKPGLPLAGGAGDGARGPRPAKRPLCASGTIGHTHMRAQHVCVCACMACTHGADGIPMSQTSTEGGDRARAPVHVLSAGEHAEATDPGAPPSRACQLGARRSPHGLDMDHDGCSMAPAEHAHVPLSPADHRRPQRGRCRSPAAWLPAAALAPVRTRAPTLLHAHAY
jgi:hypothetical protein